MENGYQGTFGGCLGTEAKHKARLRRIIGGWSESYEPGRGSGVGYPDVQFLSGRLLVPVEVKRGRRIRDRLFADRIRPSQITWHDSFLKAGGLSFVFVCFGSGKDFEVWSTPLPYREVTAAWRQGWALADCWRVIEGGKMALDLGSLVEVVRWKKN